MKEATICIHLGDMHSNCFNPPSYTDPTYAIVDELPTFSHRPHIHNSGWLGCHRSIESKGQSYTPYMPIPNSADTYCHRNQSAHKYTKTPIPTSEWNCSVNRCRDRALYIYLHCYIIPILFAFFFGMPYLAISFNVLFSCLCTCLMLISVTLTVRPEPKKNTWFNVPGTVVYLER